MYQFTNSKSGDEEIHRAEGFTDWAWSNKEQAARVRQLVQDEQYRTWVKSLGGNSMDKDTIVSLIGAGVVGVAFLFVTIAPAFPNVIVPQYITSGVYLAAGTVFGWGFQTFTAARSHAQTMAAMGR